MRKFIGSFVSTLFVLCAYAPAAHAQIDPDEYERYARSHHVSDGRDREGRYIARRESERVRVRRSERHTSINWQRAIDQYDAEHGRDSRRRPFDLDSGRHGECVPVPRPGAHYERAMHAGRNACAALTRHMRGGREGRRSERRPGVVDTYLHEAARAAGRETGRALGRRIGQEINEW
jgi:hypothetical protein